MTDWRHPHALWALAAVAVFALVMIRLLARRRDALVRFADAGLIDRLVVGVDHRRRRLRLVLRCLALALLVLVLAGPQWGFRWEEVHREGIDLIVALDTSRSMLATDVAPNRLERAKLAVMDLVRRLDGDRVGLVAFAGTAFLECPLTLDYAAFERTLRALHTGIIPRGGTSLAAAIDTSLASFDARQGKYQTLVLITDGEDHEGKVDEAAERAAQAGVKVFTVGIGTPEGELLPAEESSGFFKDRQGNVVKSRLDEQALTKIAEKSSGAYVRGLGPSLGLDEVFRDHIATMERRDVGSRLERRGEDRFQLPLAIAFVLLVVESLLAERRRGSLLARVRSLVGRRAPASVVLVGLCGVPVLAAVPARAATDPGVEGYRLYAEGQYGNAVERWREALIDQPDSPLLRFNLGAALFRDSKFDEAADAFGRVAASADAQWKTKAAYNWGNALYRVGQRAEASDGAAAAKSWEQALEAYRVAMASDPSDNDVKLAYEYVAGRLKALREKLDKEKQEKQEQQSSEQPQQGQQPQDQQKPPEQQRPGEQGEQQEQQQPKAEAQDGGKQDDNAKDQAQGEAPPQQEPAGDEPERQEPGRQAKEKPTKQQAEQQGGGEKVKQESAGEQDGQQGEHAAGEQGAAERDEQSGGNPDSAIAGDEQPPVNARAARAVLDAVRREELGPDDVDRSTGAAIVAEPSKDW